MVIASSNRSPSPMRSNPNLNPNSRINQEREGVGVRKSFSGYPFAKSSIISQPKGFIPNTPSMQEEFHLVENVGLYMEIMSRKRMKKIPIRSQLQEFVPRPFQRV
ncbi:Decapping nuclease RAI1 [Bienertia sinuspersici]